VLCCVVLCGIGLGCAGMRRDVLSCAAYCLAV
jgi:hypothetical protein